MRRSSTTSFAFDLEPAPQARLAAVALLVHGLAAASPWLAHVAPAAAAALSLLAAGALVATLARIPGPQAELASVSLDARGWRARLKDARVTEPATLSPGSRAMASLVHLDIRVGKRRFGWLLPRESLPEADFRRLKARIRLSC